MQHHHFDEFSVTDIRHTIGEVWRVIRQRKWYFVLPFMGAATLSLIASLWIPRQWTVNTVIRREHDPVLASMMGRSWTEPYSEIRQRMPGELTDLDNIEKVLASLNLPADAEHYSGGEISPAGQSRRRQLAGEVAAGLTVKNIETSPNRDVVSIRLTMSDSTMAPDLLRGLRDEYIRKAQKRTTEILRSVESFFQTESTRSREHLADLQKQLVELELKYPGINPESTDPSKSEQTAIVVENLQLARQIEELQQQKADMEAARAHAARMKPDEPPSASDATEEPNPEYAAIEAEIEKLQKDIVEARTIKGMTELHPNVLRMKSSLESKQDALQHTPVTILKAIHPPTATDPTAILKIERKISESEAKIATVEQRVKLNQEKLARIEQVRAAMLEQREPYAKLKDKIARANEELGTWQQNLGPIKHILTLEDSNRGIHFATVRDVENPVRPSTPDPRIVLGICLAIGAAIGAVVMLLAELLDRSFRTAHGVTSSLGIPVIESIDEILTQAARKRQVIRQMVILPAVAMALSLALLVAGGMAYLSIDNPADYAAIKQSPSRLFSLLVG